MGVRHIGEEASKESKEGFLRKDGKTMALVQLYTSLYVLEPLCNGHLNTSILSLDIVKVPESMGGRRLFSEGLSLDEKQQNLRWSGSSQDRIWKEVLGAQGERIRLKDEAKVHICAPSNSEEVGALRGEIRPQERSGIMNQSHTSWKEVMELKVTLFAFKQTIILLLYKPEK